MNRMLLAGMTIATIALCWEIAGGTSQDEAASAVMETHPVMAVAQVAPASVDDLAARILARPVFSSTRLPAPAAVAPVSRRGKLPRLSGLIARPDGNFAIFQPEDAPHPIVVREGATLGQWTVQSITADSVIISDDEERLVLHTVFADASSDPKSLPYSKPLATVVPRGNHLWAGRVGGGLRDAAFPRSAK